MKTMVIRLTPEKREQLKDALEKNVSELTITYEDELSDAQLDKVQGGGTSTPKVIEVLSFSFGGTNPTSSMSTGAGSL